MQNEITDNQNWRLYFRLKRYEKNYIAYQRTPMLSDYSFACKNDFHLYHIKWIYYNDYIICLAHIYFNLISAFKVNDIIPRFHISVNRQKQKKMNFTSQFQLYHERKFWEIATDGHVLHLFDKNKINFRYCLMLLYSFQIIWIVVVKAMTSIRIQEPEDKSSRKIP